MEITAKTKIGDIVRFNFKTAGFLDKMNIDYCCGGNKTLDEVCSGIGYSTELMIEKLATFTESNDSERIYLESLNNGELCDYIEKRHHSYIREKLPFIIDGMNKLCNAHGNNHPELFTIRDMFVEAANNLTLHMKKEEQILFPVIRMLVNQSIDSSSLPADSITGPVQAMMNEHETEGRRFEEISRLSSGYSLQPDACNTYRVIYQSLAEFENDLHRHIHLENNILFPSAQKQLLEAMAM
jgi:regulator of cell morphogenesis and NO signaling